MADDGERLLQAPVLVLNATYEPINVTAARRAIVLVLKGTATHRGRERQLSPLHPRRLPHSFRHPAYGIPAHSPSDPRPFPQEHPDA